ncbi:MAG: metalloregulator ArsR/SmtB family transcription factor [Metallibacterium scheffleri]|jgi:DNA-binding transcriptional ArsR family regulator|uniref:ArsR/SmtB family transcription factor n=1 Tax=Metallibacterium scheffleri TaxID=993689 RepID=UPI0026E9AD26|nr:metalloregulator ArsR/SmtB family transcription factor [Metallibacterium scheffleri]MCK9366755.1 metalloregulator ArsR/SmtB family transcription factor [Metallibacterium scheffleri]
MELNESIVALKALAQDTRLALYRLLVQAGPEGLPVGELAARLHVPDSTLSAHLRVLRTAGLVRDERRGRVIQCRADFARMDALLAYLTENCCAGAIACAVPVPCKPLPTHGAERHETLPRTRQRR